MYCASAVEKCIICVIEMDVLVAKNHTIYTIVGVRNEDQHLACCDEVGQQ
jgi:hypothetical protein